MSVERRKLLRAYGAELILTPAAGGMTGAIEAAEAVLADVEDGYMPSQFENPANPLAHVETTGPELAAAVGGVIGAFVAGVGTGGTVSGVGRYMKTRSADVRVIAVEPAESPVITQHLAGNEVSPATHGIHGIGAGFIPGTLYLDVVDEVMTVTTEQAITMSRRLAAEEGLFVGISTGANVTAALAVAERPEFEGGTVATVACSTGERYLSTHPSGRTSRPASRRTTCASYVPWPVRSLAEPVTDVTFDRSSGDRSSTPEGRSSSLPRCGRPARGLPTPSARFRRWRAKSCGPGCRWS